MARDSADRLRAEDILHAYTLGYFPMARERTAETVVWVLPDIRGVLPLDAARAPTKLKKLIRHQPFEITFDRAFHDVIRACAEATPGREDTWINDQVEEAYLELHHRRAAHSVECWRDGELVGGLYGVALGGVFCGESMFSRRTNASKVAFVYLVTKLKSAGFALLDTQFHTEHLAQFGVIECPDADYQQMLARYLSLPADFSAAPDQFSLDVVSQSITQTS